MPEKCAICGGPRTRRILVHRKVQRMFTRDEPFTFHAIKCLDCRESYCLGDHDKSYYKANDIAIKREFHELVEYFKKKKCLLDIERILGLGLGYFDEIKNPSPSKIKTEIALLRIIRIFPELLMPMDEARRKRLRLKGSMDRYVDRLIKVSKPSGRFQ